VVLPVSGWALFVASVYLLPSELLPVTVETALPNIDWLGAFSILRSFSTKGTTLNIENCIEDSAAGTETAVVAEYRRDSEATCTDASETTAAAPEIVAEVSWNTKLPAMNTPDRGSIDSTSIFLPVAAASVCTTFSAWSFTSPPASMAELPPTSTWTSVSTTASAMENFSAPDMASAATEMSEAARSATPYPAVSRALPPTVTRVSPVTAPTASGMTTLSMPLVASTSAA